MQTDLLGTGRRHTPDHVAHVVGHQQRTAAIDCDADRAFVRFALGVNKSGQHIYRHS